MDRYLIISPHTAEGCKRSLLQVYALGYITHFDWGCADGEHCGWAIIEAEDSKQAMMVVPSSDRPMAKAIRLMKVTPEQAKQMHLST